ncbi:MAG: hypothetical protein ARM1_0636 [Candidatus Micrarchaeota archaeon]|nr:MAG: hypothetical protein ARM1_0636 [Candidatus Micrarchaeota archaeon]
MELNQKGNTEKIFEIGIPEYNEKNKLHNKIAEYAMKYKMTKDEKLLEKIDELVEELLK